MSELHNITNAFVGRTYELDLLDRAIADSIGGASRVVTLSGEPGIGKTSLSKQATTSAAERGVAVLEARCYEREGIPTYWPWITIIRRYVDGCDPEHLIELLGTGAADIAKIVEEVARIADIEPGQTSSDEEEVDLHQARFRLFDAVTRFFIAICRESPLMIFIDNLHCADLGSLQLLEFVAQECDAVPLMILATYRDNELTPSHPLNFTLGELSRHIGHEHLGLKGLNRNEITQLFERSAEGSDTDKSLIDVVGEKTDGNPLYLKEVLAAQQTGRGIGQTAAEMAKKLKIPDTLRATIRARIQAMGDDSRRVLVAASLLGREFEVPMLSRFVDRLDDSAVDVPSVDEKLLVAILQEAQGAAIIESVEDRPGALRFCHALIQEVVLDDAESVALDPHWHVASFLEKEHGDEADEHASEIYPHYFLARKEGASSRARYFAFEAAIRAWENSSYEAAIEYLEPYVTTVGDTPGNADDASLVALLGRSYRDAGAIDEAAEYLGRAFSYYEQAGDISTAVDIATERLIFFQEDSAIVDWIERALDLVAPDSESGVLIAAFVSYLRRFRGDSGQDTVSELKRCFDVSVDGGYLRAELAVASYLSMVLNDYLDFESAARYARRAIDLSQKLGDLRSEAWSRCIFHVVYAVAAEVGETFRNIDAALEIADRLRDRRLISICLWLRGSALFFSGRFDEALHDTGRACQLGREQRVFSLLLRNQAWMDAETGNLGAAARLIDEIVPEFSLGVRSPGFGWIPYIPHLARITRDYRHFDKLRRFCDTVLGDPSQAVRRLWGCSLGLGTIAFLEHDTATAERCYRNLASIYADPAFTKSSRERTIGLVAEAAGKIDEARQLYETALSSHESSGARSEIPWDCYDLARLLNTHGSPENSVRARELLTRGASIAKELGMPPILERIKEELKQLAEAPGTTEAAEGSTGDPFAELTARELEVLKNIAKGLTNQEIARDLFISEHTAANHVRHILGKLEVNNRIEAATLATRYGLGD